MKTLLYSEVDMRKPLLLLCSVLLLLACSVTDIIPRPAPASTLAPTFTLPATHPPTITPIPTRTTTPTERPTATLIISEFNTPVILVSDVAPTVAIFSPTPGRPTGGFETIELS